MIPPPPHTYILSNTIDIYPSPLHLKIGPGRSIDCVVGEEDLRHAIAIV